MERHCFQMYRQPRHVYNVHVVRSEHAYVMIWAGNVAVQHAQGVYMHAVYTHSYTDNSERNETVGVHNAQSTSSQLQHTLQQTNSPYCIYIGKLSWGRGLSGVNECTGNTLHFIQQVAVLHSSMHHELVGLLCLRQMLGL